MSHYIDIHLRPDPEFVPHHLMAALYSKLHRALVQMGSSSIGVSFPDYNEKPATLGTRLRLFGPTDNLQQLMALPWLTGLQDHISQTKLAPVPHQTTYRRLNRIQAKSSPERLRRRQIKRHGITEAEALERVPDSCSELLALPFVVVRSASTTQTFRMFLRCKPADSATGGVFNAYGLSATATIPWF